MAPCGRERSRAVGTTGPDWRRRRPAYTGDRGGIPQEVTEAMRDAGLAHVLAISGLHMVIMAGTVFWLARALRAAVPSLALRLYGHEHARATPVDANWQRDWAVRERSSSNGG